MQNQTNFLPSQWEKLWHNRILLSGLGATLFIIGIRLLGGFQFLEWKLLDTMLRLRVAEPTDPRITIVAINEEDLQQIGVYPIPDGQVADLLQTLSNYQPRGIGLDIFRDLPVEPGNQRLAQVFATSSEIVGIERRILSSPVPASPDLPDNQVGFVDVVLDSDGFLRRDLLGATDPEGNYRFSLTIQLAQLYLEQEGIALDNGLRNPEAMRFGSVELSPFRTNEGGYVRADAGGNQLLVFPRSGSQPFQTVSLQDLKAGTVPEDWLTDRIVLVGITAPSIKDLVNSDSIQGVNPSLVSGIEFRAHALSQVLSAAMDGRSLLRSWPELVEYGWILVWGFAGAGLHYWSRSPREQLAAVVLGMLTLTVLGYGLLLQGLWLTIVPTGLAFLINSVVLYIFYLYDQGLRDRIQERQQVIEQSFDAIHNGPLQSLVQLIRQAQTETPLTSEQYQKDLQALNQELRQVYSILRQESAVAGDYLHLGSDRIVDMTLPLHELLYEVYCHTLERDFPCFSGLKFQITKFESMIETGLTLEDKKSLARFLEEALCNCGKYATGATRLKVACCCDQGRNVIQVIDNGTGLTLEAPAPSQSAFSGGRGSQQAQQLAKQLRGSFERTQVQPKGMCCSLSWAEQRSPWYRVVSFVQLLLQNSDKVDGT